MIKRIVKVSGGGSCFRVVVPRSLVDKLGWEGVTHVVVEEYQPHGIKIRRLFDDEIDAG